VTTSKGRGGDREVGARGGYGRERKAWGRGGRSGGGRNMRLGFRGMDAPADSGTPLRNGL